MSLPLNPGMSVKEFFGLGLLSVEWTCRKSPKGTFLVESPEGIPGVAKDCSMNFEFENNQICLTMGYTPVSVLAILAMPILIIDNWIALNVLLPAAVDPNPLDSFRKLMGALYGVAGLAHFVDLVVGDSILFTQMGLPQFSQLPAAAQAYAVLWCAVGPLAFLACKQSSSRLIADGGLALYGAVEVLGAYLATSNTGVSEAFVNAVVVQGIVFAAWLYSSQKEAKTVEKAND